MKNSRTVNQDAYTKFTQSSILDFAPETLASFKQAFESGRYDQVNRLYSAMYHEWDTLQKDVNKITSSLATLDFKAVAAAPDGGEPSPLAKEVAELVNSALWHNEGIGVGEWKHSFTQLIGSIYHALCRGVDVHEIIWGYDGEIYYPKEYLPVLPCYYAWANGSGEDDRLMLYPKGFDLSGGQAFPPNKFIVALNTQGPDHPMYNATFRALVPWFGAAVWGPRWLAEYCQVFGLPFRVFHVHNDQERERLEEQIQETPIFTNLVLKPEDTVDIAQPTSGTGLPQQALIDLAEKACHKLILGQTLTSDTSKDGGSRAQAQVHAGVETAEIMAVGDYVAGVLNAQLVPAIVRMNYGATPVPMPEMRCSLPTAQATKDTLDLFDGMINRLGMTIRRSDVYDRLGMQIPSPGDDVLGPAAIPSAGRDDISAAAAARYPRRGFDRIQELGNDAERLAIAAFAAASKPVRDRMRQLAEAGATPQEMLAALDTMAADPQPLADAHIATIRTALGLPNAQKNAQSIEAAANDPQKRREIAKKAADIRWAGHVKKIRSISERLNYICEHQTKNLPLNAISHKKAILYQAVDGISRQKYRVSMNKGILNHIMKEHGNSENEARRGQIAVTKHDFPRVPEVVAKPDKVMPPKASSGTPVTGLNGEPRYHVMRKFGEITYHVIVEAKKGKKSMVPVTMWKRKE